MTLQEILDTLIEFKTVTGNHVECERALAWIEDFARSLPVHMTRLSSNSFQSLVITTKKTKKPDIWLVAHLDVVPGSDSAFKPKVKGGKLYGRGAYDMKFALACYLKSFQDLGRQLSKYNIGIMITTDEEVGGMNGVGMLMRKGYRSNVAVLPDGGDFWRIEATAKGVYHVLLESKGTSAHGSRPWEGENAIDTLTEFIEELRGLGHFACTKKCDHAHGTMNVGYINGGAAVNQIPNYAKAGIDIRFMNGKELKAVQTLLAKLQKKYPGITVSRGSFGASVNTPLNNQYVKKFRALVEAHTGKKNLQPILSHGASDARFFAEHDIPVIVIRPDGGGHHSEVEWIDVKALQTFNNVIRDFATQVG